MTFAICATCGVEHAERSDVCAICADERQWVPAEGQQWTSLDELTDRGCRVSLAEVEPGLFGIRSDPEVGIGQQSLLVVTDAGSLLWDPIGYVDDASVAGIRARGPVVAVVASHPHMFGIQVGVERALGGVPVYVSAADSEWVQRPDEAIRTWTGRWEPLPGVTLIQPGGHFPGSAVVHLVGHDGRGVLLTSDTVFPNPDRTSVSFLRSYPNRIPLSGAVVDRVTRALDVFEYDRLYGNFGGTIPRDAKAVVRRSADRHMAWVRGDFDHLT